MAAITVTTARVAQVFNHLCTIRTHLAAPGGVTKGQWVYTIASGTGAGRVGSGDSAVGGKTAFKGIALNTAGEGQAVDVLEKGFVEGFEVGALNYEALLYPNAGGGILGDASANSSIPVAKVVAISDRDPATGLPSKIIQIL